MNRYFIFMGSLFLLFAFSACHKVVDTTDPAPKAEKAVPVTLLPLDQSYAGSSIHASGYFTTDDETILSFKTGGVISSILVREGDYIRKGQLLATLDVTEIEAQVQQAGLFLEKSQRDYDRAARLYADSVVTKEMLQNAQTGLEIARQQYKAAQFNLGTTQIKATGNGYVLRKFVQPGQIVGPGMPVLMTNHAGNAQWLVKVSLSDKDWGRVKIGDKASIQTDVHNGQNLDAFVSHKLEGADPVSGAFLIEVKLKGQAPASIATGLFARVSVYPVDGDPIWELPYEAVLDASGREGYVFITNDKQVAQKQKVSISGIQRDKILISKGLEGVKYLILSGSSYLRDGGKITIIEPQKSLQP
jgi:RND family efflux transporter MFP subunit